MEFDEKNFDCFSIEIARILLASGADVDVVCKQLCRAIDPKSAAESIGAYRREITSAFPDIPDFEVFLSRFGLSLKPWDEWRNANAVPFWWTAYNKTKHQRHQEYARANLKNVLNAVAGLFVVVLYLYKDKAESGELLPTPQLLRCDEKHIRAFIENDYDTGVAYAL